MRARGIVVSVLLTVGCGEATLESGTPTGPTMPAGVGPTLAGLRLVQAPGGQRLATLPPKASLSFSYVSAGLSIVAEGSAEVVTVEFTVDETHRFQQRAPFAMCGGIEGTLTLCEPSLLSVGAHRLVVKGVNAQGVAGPALTVDLKVLADAGGTMPDAGTPPQPDAGTTVDAGAVPSFDLLLVDQTTGDTLTIVDGSDVRLTIPAEQVTARITTEQGGSVSFDLDDGAYTHTENYPPFFLCGDGGDITMPNACPSALFPVGAHTLLVTRHAEAGGAGAVLEQVRYEFSVVP